ncbi:SDR family NAD(P)-dependent oxidoreductase [Phytomonospora endophytica]|uniref:3-oxoacyl-[acyl-carrier protein] reductase n=1 Tax=Phytomonospora endophytica TaxID=714109 RepID=A0A841FV38_9ACTN|nr:SDR family oxidoreductase [Phytomonospora endophytica]MBB6037588.1 3-oxoacyl-[acyl-carrier protein] reductase [Phytomonospora endophytica]GIG67886.1 3-oxoacyl-ACP reductase [Phytomonospora endophytica]
MTRHVLVTGGGTGIGRAVAAAFAAQGDTVHITGRRETVLKETAAAIGAHPHVCDHASPTALAALASALPASIDVLVNNAGGNTGIGAPEPVGLSAVADAWRRQLDANLITAVLTTELLADRLAPGGAVVHIGSIAADKGAGSYGAAKAALAAWNVDLARALGERGVTSNVVSPGYIAETEFFGDGMTERRYDALVAATNVGRAGEPADIAGTVVFLASAGARYISGQSLAVNGGAWPSR